MFGSKRSADTSAKIRMPRRESLPSIKELQELLTKSAENRGREVELMWSAPGATRSFCLTIKTPAGPPTEPSWILWEDDGAATQMVWQYQSLDPELINDFVRMADASAPISEIGKIVSTEPSAAGQPAAQPQFQSPPRPVDSSPALLGNSEGTAQLQFQGSSPQFGGQPQGAPPQFGAQPQGAPQFQGSPQPQFQGGGAPQFGAAQPAAAPQFQGAPPNQQPPQMQNPFLQGPTLEEQLRSGQSQQPMQGQPQQQMQGPPQQQMQGQPQQQMQGQPQQQMQGQPQQQMQGQPQQQMQGQPQQQMQGQPQQQMQGQLQQPMFGQPQMQGQSQQPQAPQFQSAPQFQQAAPPQQQWQQNQAPQNQAPQFQGSASTPSFGGGQQTTGGFAGARTEAAKPSSEFPASVQAYKPPERKASNEFEGSLDDMAASALIMSAAQNGKTGRLEICGEEQVGSIYFVSGQARHATTPSAYGDAAIRELVTWEKGTYAFVVEARSDMRSVEEPLDKTVREGTTLLDQKRHLKRAGLTFESYLIRKHKQLSDTELKLMLMKGEQLDYDLQKKIFDYLKFKRTFTDLLRDHPMDSTTWTSLLFNFLSCGLIEIREPDSVRDSVLDFLGEDKGHVRTFSETFIRPETGLYSYDALLFFMEYEFYRFEAYNYPLSLIIFEIQHKRQDGSGGADLLPGPAVNAAAQRIKMVKRQLDIVGHFQTLSYALLLPNTKGSSAAWLANRVYESLTATPLAKNIDRNTIALSFGIASLPADGDDLRALITAAQNAEREAKSGTFPVVMSRAAKRS